MAMVEAQSSVRVEPVQGTYNTTTKGRAVRQLRSRDVTEVAGRSMDSYPIGTTHFADFPERQFRDIFSKFV